LTNLLTGFSVGNYRRNMISVDKILPISILLTNFWPSIIRQ